MDISVKYYNNLEETLFQSYPNAAAIDAVTQKNVNISKGDFLAYMMFTEQRNVNGFRTYIELQARIQNRLNDIDDYLTFNNNSLQSKSVGNEMYGDFTERLGVALGACVVNKIHSLTQADWERIPEAAGRTGHPTFDFEIPLASTGSRFIQTENKGSVIDDNQAKAATISNHYRSIKEKKAYLRGEEGKRGIKLHHNLYYGTIGVLDNQPNSIARVWLVDPPAFSIDMDPYKYKLVARLKHYLEEFTIIGVREFILKPLRERIKEIEQASDYQRYNNVPIGMKNPKMIFMYMEKEMFAAVDTNEAFGKIFVVEKSQQLFPFLIAYPKALIKLLIFQNFDEIIKYSYDPAFMNESVQVLMLVWPKDYESKKMPDIKYVFDEKRKAYSATYYGKISHDESGRIFGLLNEPQQIK